MNVKCNIKCINEKKGYLLCQDLNDNGLFISSCKYETQEYYNCIKKYSSQNTKHKIQNSVKKVT